jgi:hypothetical protein
MRMYRKLGTLAIIAALAVALIATAQLTNVQRAMGEKQTKLLGQVQSMNEIIESIVPDFNPTIEVAGKTEVMLKDLQELNSTVAQMDVIVAEINPELRKTVSWLDTDNRGLDALAVAMGGPLGPLNLVGERTGVTLSYLSLTVAALQQMSNGLASTNAHSASAARVMTGGSAK